MLLTASWIASLDLNQSEGRRHFTEAFPVICIGGTLRVKVKQGGRGWKIDADGNESAGELSSWTVSDDGSGVCILRGLEEKEIAFNIDEVMSDSTLIEITRRPDWFNKIYPQWTVVGICGTMPTLMDYL
jgi:hypothetical protein